ncbi:uncharacterized protein KY384_002315 [Bacidia gigantensis]|uniref:uncharacterized protein n=1 Tax=Bacidia gigantensis TaxID=2732470 RepID=UPI001D0494B9|nr:uncharacterized protein KY384_002315 [Bacidia gigantensis]KAG8532438.1 hypothetical protein KY384_002315 [Bacidia gigantensis]
MEYTDQAYLTLETVVSRIRGAGPYPLPDENTIIDAMMAVCMNRTKEENSRKEAYDAGAEAQLQSCEVAARKIKQEAYEQGRKYQHEADIEQLKSKEREIRQQAYSEGCEAQRRSDEVTGHRIKEEAYKQGRKFQCDQDNDQVKPMLKQHEEKVETLETRVTELATENARLMNQNLALALTVKNQEEENAKLAQDISHKDGIIENMQASLSAPIDHSACKNKIGELEQQVGTLFGQFGKFVDKLRLGPVVCINGDYTVHRCDHSTCDRQLSETREQIGKFEKAQSLHKEQKDHLKTRYRRLEDQVQGKIDAAVAAVRNRVILPVKPKTVPNAEADNTILRNQRNGLSTQLKSAQGALQATNVATRGLKRELDDYKADEVTRKMKKMFKPKKSSAANDDDGIR